MKASTDRIILLSVGPKSRILSIATDGSDMKVLVDGLAVIPDGVTIDPINHHMFCTFMGTVREGEDFFGIDGYIERANLDGTEREVIVPVGQLFTPKQITFDATSGRIYWCDREGMRVMSSRTDGSNLTVHVETGTTAEHRQDRRRHCVGVSVDAVGRFLYWTQKGKPNGNEGSILRAPLDVLPDDPAMRTDIQVLFEALPEPIDLEWDGESAMLYWTDRGDPPKGNTLNRTKIGDGRATDHEIILSGLEEGIGLALDRRGKRIFVGDLGGHLRVVDLDRPGEGRIIFQGQGKLTGMAHLRG